jgi:N-acetyl-D-muramate 6-phosphate phosphatase
MRDPGADPAQAVGALTAAPRPLPVDGVLFDLDGTLADTAPDLAAALNRVRRDRGLQPLPLARLRPYASHGARGLLGAGMGIHPEHEHYQELRDAFLEHYAAALCVETALFAEVAALLDAIEARSLRWGIVTNKATRLTAPLLEALGLAARAHAIVCGDTTAHAKPHPAPLLHAALQLGVAPARCVYVGDAERDVIAGIAAGMRTIVARYGYIEPEDAPEDWPASGSIDTPGGLLRWLPQRPGTGATADTPRH